MKDNDKKPRMDQYNLRPGEELCLLFDVYKIGLYFVFMLLLSQTFTVDRDQTDQTQRQGTM